MTTGKMCREFSAKKFGVGTGYHYVHLTAQKTVYEQIPFRNILYLVKKKIIEIPIYFVQNLQDIVEVLASQMHETLIVKIYICEFHTSSHQRIIAKR